MPSEREQLRAKADRLYRRGLLHCKEGSGDDRLKLAVELWEQAARLYRQAGDEAKAAEMEAAFGRLSSKLLLSDRASSDDCAGPNGRGSMPLWSRLRERGDFKEWHVFLKIGCFGFGGPMAIWGLLQDELVYKRNVLTRRDFIEAAVLGDILPGPVTMDIVTYTGFRLKQWFGAWLATGLFILPSFLLMLVIEAYYDRYMSIPLVKGEFHILGAAVTGIIVWVGLKLAGEELREYVDVGIFLWAFVSSFIWKFDILYVVVLAGLAGLALEAARPAGAGAAPNPFAAAGEGA